MDSDYLYFLSERRVYCIFFTFLESNQRYHARHKSFYQYTSTKRGYIEIGLQSVCKFLQSNPPSPTHYLRLKCLIRLILKGIFSSSMGSSTYKPTVPRWSSRWTQGQQFLMSTFSCHILKNKV